MVKLSKNYQCLSHQDYFDKPGQMDGLKEGLLQVNRCLDETGRSDRGQINKC